jgi:hypothetical protein
MHLVELDFSMATSNNDNRGLLTKMVKLIRGQPESASRADLAEQAQDSEYNKSALQERIERKRQDDIVRRREFNHLRTLRKSSPLFTGSAGGRSSTFQNSAGFDPKDRALTVKKIDDIEATMSKHWLERKSTGGSGAKDDNATAQTSLRSDAPSAPKASSPTVKPAAQPVQAAVLTKPGSAQPQPGLPLPKLSATLNAFELVPFDEYDFTKMAAPAKLVVPKPPSVAPKSVAPAKPVPAPPTLIEAITPTPVSPPSTPASSKTPETPNQKPAFTNSSASRWDAGMSVFSSSELGSLEMGAGQASVNLREAAICFAEGDIAGAQEVLLTALSAENAEPELAHGYCVALLDLYSATGQRVPFEAAAIDYAERFGKSAPEWFSIPELLGHNTASVSTLEAAARPVIGRQIVWECPATLDLLAMKALRASLALNELPKHLNWAGLATIEDDAGKELVELFARWCLQKIELHFAGVQGLSAVLKARTPSSDMRVDPVWWQLRLDALRILRMRDDFEAVAMDFCMVYEISPPSWKDPLCVYMSWRWMRRLVLPLIPCTNRRPWGWRRGTLPCWSCRVRFLAIRCRL